MNLEVIQYTLKCKEELDNILKAIEAIKLMLFNNDLDEVYQETVKELNELESSSIRAIELLQHTFDRFMRGL